MSNLTTSSAGRRIASLLDENSFVEIGAKVQARSTDFNLETKKAPGDGVMTGYGLIEGNLVYVYSQDASVLGGAVGEMHAKKIVNLYHMAMKTGAPVIGLIDSAGLRLEEATDALNAFGRIYHNQAMASGVIPQITAIFGNCGGGLALIPGLTDFTFMEAAKAKLFVNSPNAIKDNYEEKKDTAAAAFQSEEAGTVDFVGSEDEIFAGIRQLISFLPSNNEEEALVDCTDDLNRASSIIASCTGDTAAALSEIADDNLFIVGQGEAVFTVIAGIFCQFVKRITREGCGRKYPITVSHFIPGIVQIADGWIIVRVRISNGHGKTKRRRHHIIQFVGNSLADCQIHAAGPENLAVS